MSVPYNISDYIQPTSTQQIVISFLLHSKCHYNLKKKIGFDLQEQFAATFCLEEHTGVARKTCLTSPVLKTCYYLL